MESQPSKKKEEEKCELTERILSNVEMGDLIVASRQSYKEPYDVTKTRTE